MGTAGALSVVLGALQVVLAVVVLRHMLRFGRTFPWLAALAVYFVVRGGERLTVAIAGYDPRLLALASDLLLVAVLVLLVLGLRRTVAGLQIAADEWQLRAREYERALRDYRRLVRHRLANPLMLVHGTALTLQARHGELSEHEEEELLGVLEAATRRLETVALDPYASDPEEQSLEPSPRVP